MKSKFKATGQLEIIHTGPDGELKNHEVIDNLVVKAGREHIIDLLGHQVQAAMSHMAIGEGIIDKDPEDTALGSELHRNTFTSKTPGTGAEANKITYIADFAPGEGTGAVTEAGIFNSAAAGNMLCRTVFAVKNKESGDNIRHIWILTVSS